MGDSHLFERIESEAGRRAGDEIFLER